MGCEKMKDYENNSDGRYFLPLQITSHMKLSTHFIYIFLIAFSLFLAVYFSFNRSINYVVFAVISALFGICTLIQWVFYGVLRLGKIEIDNRELSFRTITAHKRVLWENVNAVRIVTAPFKVSSDSFRIGLRENDDELPFFRKALAMLFGMRGLEYGIPVGCFPEINRIKLMRTINDIIDSRCPRVEETEEREDDVYPEDEI